MTMHIVLTTARRDGFVWITERSAFLGPGHGNYATIEKIRHLREHQVAFSAWGDTYALEALSHLTNFITKGAISFDTDESAIQGLLHFAEVVLPSDAPEEIPDKRGLIVAKLGSSPRVYRVSIIRHPVVTSIYDQLNAVSGDVSNPANLFVRYYYPRCNRTVEELLMIGIHTVRLARELNTASIGEPDAWVCEGGDFRQLAGDELEKYLRMSQSLDVSILDRLNAAS